MSEQLLEDPPDRAGMNDHNAYQAAIGYLVANRHRIPNRVVIDAMALFHADLDLTKRYHSTELASILHASSDSHLRMKIGFLRKAGLIEYDAGNVAEPGYLFRRIGPPPPPTPPQQRLPQHRRPLARFL